MSSFPPLPASTHPPLTGRPIPKRPARFTPDGVPDDPRFYADLDALKTSDGKPWYQTRPVIIPRICVVHTNGASREGSIQSAINWGNSATNNTKPTWQVADGRAVRLVPSNRRAIANSTPKTAETEAGVQDASYWTTAIEPRDAGYLADPAISDFLDDDAELIAQILAYESLIDGSQFKMQIPFVWTGEGVVTHTWPHDKVYTTVAGKICPGLKKKATFRDVIVPRAAQIRAAWSAPEVPPPLPPNLLPKRKPTCKSDTPPPTAKAKS